MQVMKTIFTIGHSTRSIDDFIAMLTSFQVETLADIRAIPQSWFNPQFSLASLATSLKAKKINYAPMKALGGKRVPAVNSKNKAFRSDAFRGYADHMQTGEFTEAIENLLSLSEKHCVAIMCAESDPANCHRSLVADALVIRGAPVHHILCVEKFLIHSVTESAEIEDLCISYPGAHSRQRALF
jgi:uncharacterized protein (DUF488 family)